VQFLQKRPLWQGQIDSRMHDDPLREDVLTRSILA
jgi:hypothetical protein